LAFIIALGALAIITGLTVLAYSFIPTLKRSVEKENYPPEVKVTVSDLDLSDPIPVEKLTTSTQTSKWQKPQVDEPITEISTSISSIGYSDYLSAIERLKQLIPPDKFPWAAKYEYQYPYGKNMWDYYQDEKYRKKVMTGEGIQGNIDETFEAIQTRNYKERADLLMQYFFAIKNSPSPYIRKKFLVYCLLPATKSQGNFSNALAHLTQLSDAASKIPIDSINNYQPILKLDRFKRNNAEAGSSFINMVIQHIDSFALSQRVPVLNVMLNNYSLYNDVSKQSAITKKFLSIITDIPVNKQSKALDQYYNLYVQKNAERDAQIANIESSFIMAQSTAEMEYNAKKAAKEGLRTTSAMGIGAGIAFISILAILLVFLSIQRSVRQLEEKIINN
jgi:hypothetical protein